MATYAAYFHFPPSIATTTMVHAQPLNPAFITSTYPTFQLHQAESCLPSESTKTNASALPDAKRSSLSSGANANDTINQQFTSSWFRLPAEIRNQIYTWLLCPDVLKPKELRRKSVDLSVRSFNQDRTNSKLYPEILSTCRRVYEEAQAMLYSTHIFHAHPSLLTSLPHLNSAAKPVISRTVMSLISRWQISLRLDIDPRFTLEQATGAFSGAEYLEIRVWQAQFEACDYQVLKLFTGVRGVGIAKVGGSVDPQLARWLEGVMMRHVTERRVQGGICGCVAEECPGFEDRDEMLCGRCYKKVKCEWIEKD